MKVKYVYNKGIKDVNEDTYLIKKNIFAVFDGVTGLIKYKDKQGRTGGKIAALTAKQVFSKNDRSLEKLAIEANVKILEKMINSKIDISDSRNNWATTVAAVRINKNNIECLQIADATIMVIYHDGTFKLPLGYKDIDLKTMIQWKKLAVTKEKNLYEKLKPQIEEVRKGANVSYGILDGNSQANKFIKSKKIPLKNIHSILLFTDGLLIPKQNPEEPERFKEMTDIILNEGMQKLLEHVRKIEKSDPSCRKYPRFKKHDDATGIHIVLK